MELFAVLPSFVVLGPLMLLAVLVPSVAASLLTFTARWRVWLSLTSLVSTYAIILHFLPVLPAWPVVVLGLVASGLSSRYRAVVVGGAGWAGFVCLLLVGWLFVASRFHADFGSAPPLQVFLALALGWVLTVILTACKVRYAELLSILTFVLVVSVMLLTQRPRPASTPAIEILWQNPDYDEVLSEVSPGPEGSLAFTAMSRRGFREKGAVFVVDSHGQPMDQFTAEGTLKPVFGHLNWHEGVLHFGEGLHETQSARLFAWQPRVGLRWPGVEVAGHLEGGVTVAGRWRVAPAGPVGVVAVDAETGRLAWTQPGPGWHVDTPLADDGNTLYGGSGYGPREVFALEPETGRIRWRQAAPLRSFGQPVVSGQVVYVGLGTGNLLEPLNHEPGEPVETTPSGLVLALDKTNGAELARYTLPSPAHARLAVSGQTLLVSTQTGEVLALTMPNLEVGWRHHCQGKLTAGLAVHDSQVYTITTTGELYGFDITTGERTTHLDLASHFGSPVQTLMPLRWHADRLHFGGQLRGQATVFRVKP
ncbi:MAG: PQQ-binding-like beta-propeller repeat protein [Fimbriiglobus sp.]